MGLLPKYPGTDMITHITLHGRDELVGDVLKVFLFSVAVRGSRGEAHLSDVEGNESQPPEGLSGDTRVTQMI